MTFTPKPGERARLKSSPCNGDFEFLDKVLEILDVRKPSDAYYLPRSHYACRAASVYPDRPLLVDIHRDAVWEPVAAQPEPADDRASRRRAYVRDKAPVILAGFLADTNVHDVEGSRTEALKQAGLIFDETEPSE